MAESPPFIHYCGQEVRWYTPGLVGSRTFLVNTSGPKLLHWGTCTSRKPKADELPAMLAKTLNVTLQAAQRALKAAGGDWEQATRALLEDRGAELAK